MAVIHVAIRSSVSTIWWRSGEQKGQRIGRIAAATACTSSLCDGAAAAAAATATELHAHRILEQVEKDLRRTEVGSDVDLSLIHI